MVRTKHRWPPAGPSQKTEGLAYADFFRNYESVKEFEAVKKAGIFQSAKWFWNVKNFFGLSSMEVCHWAVFLNYEVWIFGLKNSFSFSFKHLYWSIIALQWCVSFCFITKWISYTYTYIPISPPSCISLPPSLSPPSRWSQSIELISLYHVAASH